MYELTLLALSSDLSWTLVKDIWPRKVQLQCSVGMHSLWEEATKFQAPAFFDDDNLSMFHYMMGLPVMFPLLFMVMAILSLDVAVGWECRIRTIM